MIKYYPKKVNMLIGHIDYLNLLPFYQFLKQKGIKTKKAYPSIVNGWFEKGIIDAAFISSIKAQNKKCLNAGIAAKKRVKTVLVCPGEGSDIESATSNVLAKVLHANGKVVIGDKAFKEKNCTDLAKVWYEKYKLPFVFALFCTNRSHDKYKKLINEFLRKKQKIPYLTLKKYADKTGISAKEAKDYLDNIIYYKIGWQEKRALKKFWELSKKIK
ncbi:MqnA/MqnD/SBP family protein [Nautilia sp. PV-1]|jgi:chorismate dehydratase|uniref:MqnA/MqnD/SBP family protein n=1 Tax=Nautilia sp. PV-1 TaxID=2579250 RepID=UPI00143A643E|nr:MqnA/MqnD/SBP family protein [Nautilia sp. PV-1]